MSSRIRLAMMSVRNSEYRLRRVRSAFIRCQMSWFCDSTIRRKEWAEREVQKPVVRQRSTAAPSPITGPYPLPSGTACSSSRRSRSVGGGDGALKATGVLLCVPPRHQLFHLASIGFLDLVSLSAAVDAFPHILVDAFPHI